MEEKGKGEREKKAKPNIETVKGKCQMLSMRRVYNICVYLEM